MSEIQEFWHAVTHGDVVKAKQWLVHSPDLARQSHDGATALHYAAIHNDRETVDLLLDHGADLNAVDEEYGATPLGWANEKGHTEMVRYLYERGTEPDLHRSAAYGLIDRVRILLDQDRSLLNTISGYGTPLHEAVLWGHPEIVSLLLENGADPNMKNSFGMTAIQIANYPLADQFEITLPERLNAIEKARPGIIQLLNR